MDLYKNLKKNLKRIFERIFKRILKKEAISYTCKNIKRTFKES